jgi:hypothetical protein
VVILEGGLRTAFFYDPVCQGVSGNQIEFMKMFMSIAAAFLPFIRLTVMSLPFLYIRNLMHMTSVWLQLGSVPPKVTAFCPTDRQDLNGTLIVIRERIW